ncbi:MAG: uroporphyrinogen-III synthase [Verrucomicrobiaceae bacterium]|jgi:uroporphyrinogen-III synthase|nr:uroporphyrinogen-III synthase [Verrucomicrobiaceae bacterium]
MARVLLTRQDNSAVSKILKKSGVDCLDMPLINCAFEVNTDDAIDIFGELSGYDWLTFSSPNAVKGFFKAFFKEFKDIRSLGIARIACVGEATAKELSKFYLCADVIPEKQTGIDMVEAMHNFESLDNLRVLSVRGNLALPDVLKALDEKRAIVDTFEVYKTVLLSLNDTDKTLIDFKKNGADVVVFASPSAVQSFVNNASKLALSDKAVRPKIVAIGSTTAEAVKKYSMNVVSVAQSPSPEDIAKAVLELLK